MPLKHINIILDSFMQSLQNQRQIIDVDFEDITDKETEDIEENKDNLD